jgi:hypothetical protein
MKKLLSIVLLLIIFLGYSCLKDSPEDFNNPESSWNPSFSIAIGQTSLKMNEDSGFDTLLLLNNPTTGYPFWVEEFDVPLEYTMPFDLQEITEFSEDIVSLMFRFNVDNGFPADAIAQAYFLDISNNVVDSLFVNGPLTFDEGEVNSEGESVKKTHTQNDIVFEGDKIDALSDVRNVLLKGSINNLALDTNLIEFYPNYSVDIQMGVQVELNMSLSQDQLSNNNIQ